MRLNAKSFAQMFVRTRNSTEAALLLGEEPQRAKAAGEQLYCDSRVQKEIKRLDKENPQSLCYVKTGLSRLAFGSVNDAVQLVFDDEITEEKIAHADLFNVSEIKRIKGGGVEVKFWDRQKALEKLVELDPDLKEISDAEKFIQAVYSGSTNSPDEEGI